jgi:hypothetical protein
LRFSSHITVLPRLSRNICDTSFFSHKKALVVGSHDVAIVLVVGSVDIIYRLVTHLHGSCCYEALQTVVSLSTLSFCGCNAAPCKGRLRQRSHSTSCYHQKAFALPISSQTAVLQDASRFYVKDAQNMRAKLPKECSIHWDALSVQNGFY